MVSVTSNSGRASPNWLLTRGWSARCCPTCELLTAGAIPRERSSGAGPIPESMRSLGVLTAPAEMMISLVACKVNFGATTFV